MKSVVPVAHVQQSVSALTNGHVDDPIPRKRGRPRKIRTVDESTDPPDDPPSSQRTYLFRTAIGSSDPNRRTFHDAPQSSTSYKHHRRKSGSDRVPTVLPQGSSSTKLRLRFSSHSGPVITNPLHITNPRKHPSFVDWYEGEDSRLPDDPALFSKHDIFAEADIRNRLFQAAQSGGVLHQGVSHLSLPEAQSSIPRQYTHHDHLITRAVHFQKLMVKDRRERVALAKRTALACQIRHSQLVVSEEDLELEEENRRKALYRWVLKSLQLTWSAANAEVEESRTAQYLHEQNRLSQKELKDRLDKHQAYFKDNQGVYEAVSLQSGADSDGWSDEDHGSASESRSQRSSTADSEDMSSSDSDKEKLPAAQEEADDTELTIEELRAKYKRIDETKPASPAKGSSLPSPPSCTDYPSLDKVDDVMMDDFDEESSEMDDDTSDDGSDSEENEDNEDSEVDDDDSDEPMASLADLLVQPPKTRSDRGDRLETRSDGEEDMRIDRSVPAVSSPYGTPQSEELTSALQSRRDSPGFEPERSRDSSGTEAATLSQTAGKLLDGEGTENPVELGTCEDQSAQSTDTVPATKGPIDTPVPHLLRGKLRDYQHEGLDWLAKLYQTKRNGILADEMGLGKTIQSIALLAHLACEHHVWGPHLVVVPTSVILNWEMEFKKWCPGLKILTYYGDQKQRKKLREGWTDDERWNVCITSYNIVGQDKQVFRRRRWQYFILDEAHNIKNFRSQKWQTLISFNTRARLLLTGTPLQNSLEELWSLMFFLMPSAENEEESTQWFQLHKFQELFGGPARQIMDQGESQLDVEGRNLVNQLHELLRPFLLRRLKSQVEKQMPQKHEHIIMCRLSKRQRELYDGFMGRARTREQLASGNTISVMNALMSLRKVCNHPDLFETRPIKTSWMLSKPATAGFEIKDLILRRRLLKVAPISTVSLNFLNLVPAQKEMQSLRLSRLAQRLSALATIEDDIRRISAGFEERLPSASTILSDGHSVKTVAHRQHCRHLADQLDRLQHKQYTTRMRLMKGPMYGADTHESIRIPHCITKHLSPPKQARYLGRWLHESSSTVQKLVPSILDRAQTLSQVFQKFIFVTPEIVIPDVLNQTLTTQEQLVIQEASAACPQDPYKEPRIRQAIAFPDKRLLQFDCGKLQKLDSLLRTLQAGGHRALIFTQMTRVLDILEQFLNIHGHLYLRLDGSTKVEQRQILTDRFNNDPRILCFILSSRSGGLGINLTGADTVIFYDMDWNPAMDKQCQDRCHRIGQTRDVHIYRFVSEFTIESNILKKANQKRLLDDVMIQQGDFTTDYFNKMSVRDILGDDAGLLDGEDEEGNLSKALVEGLTAGQTAEKALEMVEDKTDAVAAREARKEIVEEDDGNFGGNASGSATPGGGAAAAAEGGDASKDEGRNAEADGEERSAEGKRIGHVDEYMVRLWKWELADVPVVPPDEKARLKNRKRKRM